MHHECKLTNGNIGGCLSIKDDVGPRQIELKNLFCVFLNAPELVGKSAIMGSRARQRSLQTNIFTCRVKDFSLLTGKTRTREMDVWFVRLTSWE